MRSVIITQRRSREVIWESGRTGGTNSKYSAQVPRGLLKKVAGIVKWGERF